MLCVTSTTIIGGCRKYVDMVKPSSHGIDINLLILHKINCALIAYPHAYYDSVHVWLCLTICISEAVKWFHHCFNFFKNTIKLNVKIHQKRGTYQLLNIGQNEPSSSNIPIHFLPTKLSATDGTKTQYCISIFEISLEILEKEYWARTMNHTCLHFCFQIWSLIIWENELNVWKFWKQTNTRWLHNIQ